jgi:hypothetical protein
MIELILCFVKIVLIANSEAAWHQVWDDGFNGHSLNETICKYEEGFFGLYFGYSAAVIKKIIYF